MLANSEIQSDNQNYLSDLKSYVSVNEVLQIRLMDGQDATTYYSRIQDIKNGKLVIAWPTNRGLRLLAHADQMLNFFFVREGMPHSFSGLVDTTESEPLPQITIILASAVTQVQRRQNFRIKCLVPIEIVGNIKEDARDEISTPLFIKTVSTDLSAGGISFRHAKRLPEGSFVDVKLALPDNEPVIKIPCNVIYSEYITENQTLYRTGLRFIALTEGDAARIVRHVYKTQLKGVHP